MAELVLERNIGQNEIYIYRSVKPKDLNTGSAFIDLMVSQNITLRVNFALYEAFKEYCKKNGLLISSQFEIMMEEKVGLEYKNNDEASKLSSKDTISNYSGSLTGEPFMLYENKVIASLLLQDIPTNSIKDIVLRENLFGYKTLKSVPKRVNAIIKRIRQLDRHILNKITNDLSGDGKIAVLYSIYLKDKLFREFLNEFIAERFSIRDFNFDKKMIHKFINDKADFDKKIQGFTKETRMKLTDVIFNILKDSGLVMEKENYCKLNNLMISSDLRNYYEGKKEIKFLKCLGVSV